MYDKKKCRVQSNLPLCHYTFLSIFIESYVCRVILYIAKNVNRIKEYDNLCLDRSEME